MKFTKLLSLTAASMLALSSAATSAADEVKLPRNMAWSAFDVGSSGYNQAVAIGKALQDAYGMSLRVVPAGNDVSRLASVRDGRIPFACTGNDVFFASEGVSTFATPTWGPQSIRILISASADNGYALATARDANIRTMADVRGKRVAFILGAPALQTNIKSFLAYGDLTLDDIVVVESAGYGAAFQQLMDGHVDATTSLTTGGIVEQAAASPRGLYWVPMPFRDTEGWKRLSSIAPHQAQRAATLGATIKEDEPLECMGAPYPILVTYASQDADLVYNLTKAVATQVPAFASSEPTASGWAADRQLFQWVVPFADAAIRYWKEQGLWTDEHQKHNDALVKRQKILAAAWAGMTDRKGDDFEKRWLGVRAEALRAAGLPVYFE